MLSVRWNMACELLAPGKGPSPWRASAHGREEQDEPFLTEPPFHGNRRPILPACEVPPYLRLFGC
jgi:hypothetical protein